MNLRNCLAAFAAAILFGVGVHAIADDAATKPSNESRTSSHSRLIAPFSLLTDLTDDQKTKIKDIHAQALDQEKQIRDKENDDIMALLSDNQKMELDDLKAKEATERKASTEERRAKSEEEKAQELKKQADSMSGSTTQPSGGQ
jgi:Spy/CpxP family protein refolding chaperone